MQSVNKSLILIYHSIVVNTLTKEKVDITQNYDDECKKYIVSDRSSSYEEISNSSL